jgi:chromosomal replication initiator protein
MDDRLRSRFESGLVADIVAPDTETRTAIVRAKAEAEGCNLPHDVCEFLAIWVPGNVRTLEGALTRLIAQSSMDGEGVSIELAQKVIESGYPQTAAHKPQFDRILDEVSKYFDVPRREILGQSRKADIAHARHFCVYMVRTILGDSWKRMAEKFGGRDHTSMIHAYRKIQNLLLKDLETQTDHRNLERRLSACD